MVKNSRSINYVISSDGTVSDEISTCHSLLVGILWVTNDVFYYLRMAVLINFPEGEPLEGLVNGLGYGIKNMCECKGSFRLGVLVLEATNNEPEYFT